MVPLRVSQRDRAASLWYRSRCTQLLSDLKTAYSEKRRKETWKINENGLGVAYRPKILVRL